MYSDLIKEYVEYKNYPKPEEVDEWVHSIWKLVDSTTYTAEKLPENGYSANVVGVRHVRKEFSYVKFDPKGFDTFYGYWQPTQSEPAPLLIHTPGYSAYISMHPELASQGYNVLDINPLGYTTPDGPDESKMRDGNWPVYADTIKSGAKEGYKIWLMNCILAIKWAMEQQEVLKGRVSFFGTSQGGAGSLLLGSLYKDRGVRCVAADLSGVTNMPIAKRHRTTPPPARLDNIGDEGWRALGFADTVSHAHRLTCPVLLTAGGKDSDCPAIAQKALFERLPGTCSYNYFDDLEHRGSREFITLVSAWFRMYA